MSRPSHVVAALFAAIAVLLMLAGCADDSASTPVAADESNSAESTAPAPSAVPPTTASPTPAAAATPIPEPASEPSASTSAPETTQNGTAAAVVSDPVVYDGDFGTSIAPIFADKCASCHNAGGPGAPHWQLEQAGDLGATHQWIAGVVDTGFMPPWPASDLSLTFHNNRSLRADEVQAIVAWSADGGPLDVAPATRIVAPAPSRALETDIEIAPNEPYQGSTDLADDYRCLIYDPQLTEPTWVAGFEFVPDQERVVHHAVGYVLPDYTAATAQLQNDADDAGGWECYGGPRLPEADLFIGWAPGQEPTIYPEGAGFEMQPGDYFVVQIHYHFDVDAPLDASSLRIDWSEADNLDRIEFQQLTGPAEIPCAADETGPLCDRDVAIAQAREQYGPDGVLADVINRRCGVNAEDFVLADDGTIASTCEELVPAAREVIAVFGHQHEIGKSIRLTLNAGQPDEKILLDIPQWSFDWQLNYELAEPLIVNRGDRILLECVWDRSLRAPDLEPAYVLWADGTNDEMCFATVTTRPVDSTEAEATETTEEEAAAPFEADLDLPPELRECLAEGGITSLQAPAREDIDPTVDRLFECASPEEIGDLLSDGLETGLDGLLSADDIDCISAGVASPEGARDLLTFGLPDASAQERQPIADLVGDCVPLSGLLTNFGLPVPDGSADCIDEGGRDLLVQAARDLEFPDQIAILTLIGVCQSE